MASDEDEDDVLKPIGFSNGRTRAQVVAALTALAKRRPTFAGDGEFTAVCATLDDCGIGSMANDLDNERNGTSVKLLTCLGTLCTFVNMDLMRREPILTLSSISGFVSLIRHYLYGYQPNGHIKDVHSAENIEGARRVLIAFARSGLLDGILELYRLLTMLHLEGHWDLVAAACDIIALIIECYDGTTAHFIDKQGVLRILSALLDYVTVPILVTPSFYIGYLPTLLENLAARKSDLGPNDDLPRFVDKLCQTAETLYESALEDRANSGDFCLCCLRHVMTILSAPPMFDVLHARYPVDPATVTVNSEKQAVLFWEVVWEVLKEDDQVNDARFVMESALRSIDGLANAFPKFLERHGTAFAARITVAFKSADFRVPDEWLGFLESLMLRADFLSDNVLEVLQKKYFCYFTMFSEGFAIAHPIALCTYLYAIKEKFSFADREFIATAAALRCCELPEALQSREIMNRCEFLLLIFFHLGRRFDPLSEVLPCDPFWKYITARLHAWEEGSLPNSKDICVPMSILNVIAYRTEGRGHLITRGVFDAVCRCLGAPSPWRHIFTSFSEATITLNKACWELLITTILRFENDITSQQLSEIFIVAERAVVASKRWSHWIYVMALVTSFAIKLTRKSKPLLTDRPYLMDTLTLLAELTDGLFGIRAAESNRANVLKTPAPSLVRIGPPLAEYQNDAPYERVDYIFVSLAMLLGNVVNSADVELFHEVSAVALRFMPACQYAMDQTVASRKVIAISDTLRDVLRECFRYIDALKNERAFNAAGVRGVEGVVKRGPTLKWEKTTESSSNTSDPEDSVRQWKETRRQQRRMERRTNTSNYRRERRSSDDEDGEDGFRERAPERRRKVVKRGKKRPAVKARRSDA